MKRALKWMPLHLENVENIKFWEVDMEYLMLNTPPLCNYECKKCFTEVTERAPKNTLSLDEMLKTIHWGKEKWVKVICILWEWEPLVYQHFKTAVKYVNKNWMIPVFVSNWYLLDKETVDFLYENNAVVVVSLDTLDEKEYEEYCWWTSDLKTVLNNLNYAKKKFSNKIIEKNWYEVFSLAIHMTVTAKNFKYMKQIEDFCWEEMYFDCQWIADVWEAKKNEDYVWDEKLYHEYMKNSEEAYKPMVITKTEKWDDVCCLFYYWMAIWYDWEVMFDTHAPWTRFFWNIRDWNIEELKDKVRWEIKEYFAKYRTMYCPVRDSSFEKFVEHLSKKYWKERNNDKVN
jgi:sulfatase maturation enzyme AslB (radical SAM superfamily)